MSAAGYASQVCALAFSQPQSSTTPAPTQSEAQASHPPQRPTRNAGVPPAQVEVRPMPNQTEPNANNARLSYCVLYDDQE